MAPTRVCAFLAVLYLCGFGVSRIYLLHLAYNHRSKRHESEEWLVQQCRTHEFYHNMKHHSSVCEDVEMRASESLWLGALAEVVSNTYMCGDQPCQQLAGALLQWLAGQGIMVTIFALFCLFILPTICVPLTRMRQLSQTRRDMHALYMHHDAYHVDPYFRPQIADSTREVHHNL